MRCNTHSSGASNGSTYDCQQELQRLYNAYMAAITGKQMTTMQDGNYRRIEYGPADADKILKMYNLTYAQCGATSGLPDLRYVNNPQQKALQFSR